MFDTSLLFKVKSGLISMQSILVVLVTTARLYKRSLQNKANSDGHQKSQLPINWTDIRIENNWK